MSDEARLVKSPMARWYLGNVSVGKFWQMRKEGLIKDVKMGRGVWYDRDDLDALIERLKEASS